MIVFTFHEPYTTKFDFGKHTPILLGGWVEIDDMFSGRKNRTFSLIPRRLRRLGFSFLQCSLKIASRLMFPNIYILSPREFRINYGLPRLYS